MSSKVVEIVSRSVAQTLEIGRGLGSRFEGGEVVGLVGTLGTGKTHLIKGMASGLGFEEGDPELELLVQGTPQEYLSSYEKALTAKRERLSETSQPNPAGNPGALGSGTAATNELEGVIDSDVLWEKAMKKMSSG